MTYLLHTPAALVFNLKDYNARGDGSTDDSVALNAAMTAAASAGGQVYAPHGTYILNPDTVNNITVPIVGESMAGTVFKLKNAYNGTNNLVRLVSVSNISISNLTIDGNKANQTGGTQFGLYVSTSTHCLVSSVLTKNWTGDGTQLYNSTSCVISNSFSTGNTFHGFEIEQCVNCTIQGSRGYSDILHGLNLTPGEVGSTGSQGNHVVGNSFDSNGQYGINVASDNGGAGAWLSEGNVILGNSVTGNGQYGICLYQEDKTTIESNYIKGNGFYGLYGYQSSNNRIAHNLFHNNSQAGSGAYDEIYFEGNAAGHASINNNVSDNTIVIDGTTKARYAINEGSNSDGPNTFSNNTIPSAGTSGTINQLVKADIISSPGGVVQIGDDGQAIQGNNAGFDSAFNHIMRLFNNFTSGSTQFVNPNGNAQFYSGGTETLDVNNGNIAIVPGSTATAGGVALIKIGNNVVNIAVGSGAPTLSAPQGSLYLRTDGSSTSTRMYVNTNGTTGWTAVTTAT